MPNGTTVDPGPILGVAIHPSIGTCIVCKCIDSIIQCDSKSEQCRREPPTLRYQKQFPNARRAVPESQSPNSPPTTTPDPLADETTTTESSFGRPRSKYLVTLNPNRKFKPTTTEVYDYALDNEELDSATQNPDFDDIEDDGTHPQISVKQSATTQAPTEHSTTFTTTKVTPPTTSLTPTTTIQPAQKPYEASFRKFAKLKKRARVQASVIDPSSQLSDDVIKDCILMMAVFITMFCAFGIVVLAVYIIRTILEACECRKEEQSRPRTPFEFNFGV